MLNIGPRVNGWKTLGNSILYIIEAWSRFESNVAGSSQEMWKDHELKIWYSQRERERERERERDVFPVQGVCQKLKEDQEK